MGGSVGVLELIQKDLAHDSAKSAHTVLKSVVERMRNIYNCFSVLSRGSKEVAYLRFVASGITHL